MTTNFPSICPSFNSLPSFEMVVYDYLEGKLDNLGNGKLTLVRSQYSEVTFEGSPPLIEPRQTNYTFVHSYEKHGAAHLLGLKVNFNFTGNLLSIQHTPSEHMQNYQLKTLPLDNILNDFTSTKVKQIYRELTTVLEAVLNGFQSNVSGVRLQPSIYSHRLFHGNTTFSVTSELVNGRMEYKQYTTQETLLMKRVLNHPLHIGVSYQGYNRFFNDLISFEPPYDSQDVWYKIEDIRR